MMFLCVEDVNVPRVKILINFFFFYKIAGC